MTCRGLPLWKGGGKGVGWRGGMVVEWREELASALG